MIVMKEDDIDHDDWVGGRAVGMVSSTNRDLEWGQGGAERETVNSSS